MAERGYPLNSLYATWPAPRSPRWLATNLGLLEVLPDVDLGYDHAAPAAGRRRSRTSSTRR